MRLIDRLQISSGVLPVNLATAANDGDWVSLKKAERCLVVFFKAIGTAGDDPTLTMEQATAAAGTGAKALTFTRIYKKQGADLFAIGQFTEVTQAAAATYTNDTSAEEQAIWCVEIKGDDLDVNSGFCFIRARVADIGANAQLGCILYIHDGFRYVEQALPSVIA